MHRDLDSNESTLEVIKDGGRYHIADADLTVNRLPVPVSQERFWSKTPAELS